MAADETRVVKSGKFSGKKQANKRSWRKITVNEDDTNNFEEGGLISVEELTDYSVLESQGIRLTDLHGEPSVKKKRNGRKNRNNQNISMISEIESQSNKKGKETKISKKKKKKTKREKKTKDQNENHQLEQVDKDACNLTENKVAKIRNPEKSIVEPPENDSNPEFKFLCDMSDWNGLGIPDPILATLSEKGFSKPTPIQAATLPIAIFHHQDVIGAAETGSGKTFAFALPILTHILNLKQGVNKSDRNSSNSEERPFYALILTPTRELALQINKHIRDIAKNVPITCAAIVGGLSAQKQERILGKSPEIIVGTPGRLLDMINDGKAHLGKVKKVKFLVIDEVDRMLQLGHFREVIEIMRHLSECKMKRQTFLFSATLTLPQYHKSWSGKKGKKEEKESIELLVDKVNISSKAKVIDLSNQHIAAEQIDQKRIICMEEEKDLYLLYILCCYPGRTLVFVNSINCTRKICSFLSILEKNPLQLHAGKQQRQRLKALDKFMSSDNAILIATDVAARGLDVPDVELVVHYHLPKDPKIYIHRSGRTARAKKMGMSVILEGPQDFKEYKKIYEAMKLTKDLPPLSINASLLPDIKKRVLLAKKIDQEEHKQRKKKSEQNWFKKAADSLDIQFDDSDDVNYDSQSHKKKVDFKVKGLRKELENLLKLPLVPTGFSGNYITRTGALQKIGK